MFSFNDTNITLYFESTESDDLRKFGYSKDHRFNTTQVVLALATNSDGLPIGSALFEGNRAEVKTLAASIESWKKLFNIGKNLLKNAQLKDVETLKELDITTLNTKSDKVTLELARTEMINSFTNPDKTRSNGQINAYTHITEGLKVHNQSAEIYVYGLRIRKETIIEGVYPTVNSKPLTVAKNELKTLLKSSKYVQLKVSEMIGLTGNKETLEFKA